MLWDDINQLQSSLWGELSDLQSRLNRALGSARAYPGIRIYQKDDEALLVSEIPGVNVDDIDLNVQDDVLTIVVDKKAEEVGEDTTYLRNERNSGKFSRSVRLPFRADSEKVEAEYSKGILKIRLPMREEEKPRKISVKT